MNYIKELGILDVLDSLDRDYGNKWSVGKLEETLKGDPRLKTLLKLRELTTSSGTWSEGTKKALIKRKADAKKKGVYSTASPTIGLKKLRVEKGLTQPELSNIIFNRYGVKMSRNSISMYERGVTKPVKAGLEAFADYFGLTVVQMQAEFEKERNYHIERMLELEGEEV